MPNLIGFGGYAGAGKDTAAQVLVDDHGYQLLSFGHYVADLLADIDPLVEVEAGRTCRASVVLDERGYEAAKLVPDFVRLLQDLGSAVNDRDPGFWSRLVLAGVAPSAHAVISGVRSPAQIAAVRDAGGVTVWVERPGVGPRNGHRNETAAGPDDFDLVVRHDRTVADLHAAVRGLIEGERDA